MQRVLPAHGVVGETTVLRYQITNCKRWMPVFGLVIHEAWGKPLRRYVTAGSKGPSTSGSGPCLGGTPFGWVLHLGTRQSVQAEAPCWPLRRGFLPFEKVVFSTSFPFSIVRRVVVYDLPGRVLIYPRLWRINQNVLSRLANVVAQGHRHPKRAGGNEEFFGMRPYRPGDSFKTIDWKRSAKTGQLITREMTQQIPPKVVIVLDLSHPPDPRATGSGQLRKRRRRSRRHETASPDREPYNVDPVEAAVSLTASLVCDAYFRGHHVGLVVVGVRCKNYPIHHSPPHRMKMLESLSLLDTTNRIDTLPALPADPSVVVVPATKCHVEFEGRAFVLNTQYLEEYVTKIQDASATILGRGEAHGPRRQQLRNHNAWK